MEIIAIIKSRKTIKSDANFGYIFHNFWCLFINFHQPTTNFDEKKLQNDQKTIIPKKVDFIVKN